MSRRAARIAAVEVLYAADVREIDPEQVLSERGDANDYAERLVREAASRRDELDTIIGRHSVGWRLERMSPIDRNVLRIGVLELLGSDVPAAAVIDEAVEVAKRFSGAEAGRFVNGVLAAVLQELGGDQGGAGGAGGGGGGGTGGGPNDGGSTGAVAGGGSGANGSGTTSGGDGLRRESR